MPLARLPPAFVKVPPTYRSLPDTASAYTVVRKGPPLTPRPSAVQALPSHLALGLGALPPVFVEAPPIYKSLPATASAWTSLVNPPMLIQFSSLKVGSIRTG